MARMPGVKWVGPSPNITENGLSRPYRVRGVVVHIAEGYFDGTISWQKNKAAKTSSHFIIDKNGEIVQMVDTDDAAWTQRDGNSTWLSIEYVGFAGQYLTAAQVEAGARVLLWAHRTFPDIPLQLASSPSGRGLGHHSMGAESGSDWGHSACPGMPIKTQKAGIVALAISMASGGTNMAGEKADAFASAAEAGTPAGTANPFWAINALRETLTHVRTLVTRPAAGTVALTAADHEAIGKATARALLDIVAKQ